MLAVTPMLLTPVLLTMAAPVVAQVGACVPGGQFSAGPTLLSSAEGERRLGAAFSAAACSSGHDLRRTAPDSFEIVPPRPFPFSWTLGGEGRFSLIRDGRPMPGENHVAGRGGLSVSLSKPAEPFICPDEMPDEECAQRMVEVGSTAFDLGFVSLSGRVRYESSLGFSEQQLAGGAELRYGHLRGYIPSLVVTYDVVKPLQSDVRQAVGVPDDSFSRWMLQGYVRHQVGRVRGDLEAAGFWASGMASQLDEIGWSDGGYVAGTVSVVVDRPIFGALRADRIYVRYSDGEHTSLPRPGQTWGVGFELTVSPSE